VDDGVAATDIEAISSADCKTRFGVRIVGGIHAQFGPCGESVRHLRNFLPVRSNVERTDNVGANQVGASDRQRVYPIGLTISAQRQSIRGIERRRDVQVCYEEPPEYRVLVALLPIDPSDFHVFALIRLQWKIHLATWVTRLRQSR